MRGLTWMAVLGFVGAVLTLAFKVPHGLRIFHVLGAGGAMAGYAVGDYTVKFIGSKIWKVILVVFSLIVLVSASISYSILIEENYSGPWIVVVLGVLLTSTFFSLSYLMAVAGVVIGDSQLR